MDYNIFSDWAYSWEIPVDSAADGYLFGDSDVTQKQPLVS